MKPRLLCLLAAAALVLAGCGGDGDDDSEKKSESPASTTEQAAKPSSASGKKPRVEKAEGPAPKRLVKKDLIEGRGRAATAGDALTVHYVGVLRKNGKQFDASWDRGEPFDFQLGAGMVIPGWDKGLAGMKQGGRRRLEIPAELAYGAQGSPPDIGPNEPLVFVIDLVRIR